MQLRNNIQTEWTIGRAVCVHIYLYAFNNKEKEVMDLKEQVICDHLDVGKGREK